MPADHNQGCFAIILAAGKSSRMGSDKAALPWLDGKPLLLWMMDELTAAGWHPLAVLSPERYKHWSGHLPEGCTVLNPHPERGKTSSIAAGVQWLPASARWILITAVDQPAFPSIYRQLRAAADSSAAAVVIPKQLERRGHPPVVSAALCKSLLKLEEDTLGLRGLLDRERHNTFLMPVSNPASLGWDLNTPDAYRAALEFFRSA